MIHTADMMRAFAPYRGDAILVPGAAAATGSTSATTSRSMSSSATRRWAAMPASPRPGTGAARTRRSCCSIRGRHPDEPRHPGTVAEQAPPNLYHFLIDNGIYATTGGQPVPNATRCSTT